MLKGQKLADKLGDLSGPAPQARKLRQPDGVRGERKGKIEPGRLRGGKNSHDWGDPTAWLNAKAPPATVKKVKVLAAGHNLHIWQVLVEAVELFEREYGEEPGAGRKKSA
jgi:hypothetical protein